ncbi:MAG: SPOR domain-containing protein [Rickettsiales bacterium]|jgi:cell division protein FtsN|nr:SPOR domain-containing protein [Rickettsiales bacterium]
MKKILVLLPLFLISCASQDMGQPRVKLVDSQGNPVKLNKIVPKFNAEQLEKQRETVDRTQNSENRKVEITKFKQINTNFDIESDDNIINNEANEGNGIGNAYPDELFADRITNYNYNYTQQMQNESPKKESKVVVVNTEEIKATPPPSSQPKTTPIPAPSPTIKNKKGYYIQIGIYSEKKNAQNMYNKFKKINMGEISEYVDKNGKVKYKVALGPYNERKYAGIDMNKIINTGHYDVYIAEQK